MPPHVEKIQVMFIDGTVAYLDSMNTAQNMAMDNVRLHADQTFDAIAWIGDDECFAVDVNRNVVGSSVLLTQMLIPLEDWEGITRSSTLENLQMTKTLNDNSSNN